MTEEKGEKRELVTGTRIRSEGDYLFYDRELSWLAFNHRVLQEAKDPSVPLYEKLKFLAIYSSNLDEFFRVRVASLRSIIDLKEKTIKKLHYDPVELLKEIHKTVDKQQTEFGKIYEEIVLKQLAEQNICFITEKDLDEEQGQYVEDYFNDYVRPWIRPMIIIKKRVSPFLKNNALYLAIKLYPIPAEEISRADGEKRKRPRYANVEIPTDHVSRFLVLPEKQGKHYVMFLDDVIRHNLRSLFPGYDVDSAYSIKLTRDADLYIDDEFSGNLVKKIKKNLQKRRTGLPSRFLYDAEMPSRQLRYFQEAFSIKKEDLMPGARYHNYSDFFKFPKINTDGREYTALAPMEHHDLNLKKPILPQLEQKDYLLHYPYHCYDYVLKFLNDAADDPDVVAIKISLYRVAARSKVVKALVKAAQKGKEVTVFSEVKARFDELSNILSAEKLEEAGANVLYSLPGLKVHAKLCVVTKKVDDTYIRYGYLATGNFNENTAKLYGDLGLFTCNEGIVKEINKVFKLLGSVETESEYKELLVAPVQMRQKFVELIDTEIEAAKRGEKAEINLKMNSLEDKEIIKKLYEANNAGVKIKMIVRGICCLVPGVQGMSENIKVISIVDRFLEHARIYHFHHQGSDKIYLASADWMTRNLSRRIETAFPIYDKALRKEIRDIMRIQFRDNTKARIVNKYQNNRYRKGKSDEKIQAQLEIYNYHKKQLEQK